MEGKNKLREREEIQRAHDRLVSVITGEVKIEMCDEDKTSLHHATDVLCWILLHEHNGAFAENLFNLETELAQKGYVLEKKMEKGAGR